MNMSLHKIYKFLGYNNLGVILEQERKHWLLKPDKKLNVQDSATGSIFQGKLDNLGNEIIAETNKTEAYTGSDMLKFKNDNINDILEPLSSGLPYNNSLNGLMYECIVSSKIAYDEGGSTSYKNYKLEFTNCEEVIIPFGNSLESGDVYYGKWIKTTTKPTLLLPDNGNAYTIRVPVDYEDSVTNVVYYYPLEENLQPLIIDHPSSGTYITEAITNHTYIGYPMYWFTCDNTDVGPHVTIENNIATNNRNLQLMYITNPGNVSKYETEVFCSVAGENDATPDGDPTSQWKVVCKTRSGIFTNTTADTTIPLDLSSIKLVSLSNGTEYPMPFTSVLTNNTLTLASINLWARSGNEAWSLMSNYDANCYFDQLNDPMIPLFSLHLDESVSFMHNTTDVGYAGFDASSEPYSETTARYPHDLNKWDGLPTWLQNNEEGVPQHAAIYAIHNTPNYNPNDPTTRQTAALLFDPGKPKTSEGEEFTNDERGRVYYISNDSTTYENNATTDDPKPARTLARICDIPTTLIQLSDISGLAPTNVVDKNYVHTDVSFSEAEKHRIYNTLSSRWVRPIHLDTNGNPITNRIHEDNDYIFTYVHDLDDVSLDEYNDFRRYINLNPVVDPNDIEPGLIYSGGDGYGVGDEGVIIIGGSSIIYAVTEINETDPEHHTGVVTGVELRPNSSTSISLSNFDMEPTAAGTTKQYGTSPTTGTGTQLRLTLVITNYEDIRMKRGSIYSDLFALVRLSDGLWLYKYVIENNNATDVKFGNWVKHTIISEAESSSIISNLGGLSTTDSYMMSLVATIHSLPVAMKSKNQSMVSLRSFTTPACVNIVDTSYIPYTPVSDSRTSDTRDVVDINKMYSSGVLTGKSVYRSGMSIIQYLKANNQLQYDCYVAWKWKEPDNINDTNFYYMIIQRSFNNFISTNTTTYLPGNSLNYDQYVHTNEQTTIVWNIEGIGPMMWVYDPTSIIHETYDIDPDTRDITISRKNRSWVDVDIKSSDVESLVDNNGKLTYNIWSNNPTQQIDSWITENDPPYQQPNFTEIARIGQSVTDVSNAKLPVGSWRLVFPRVAQYSLSNIQNGLKFDAIRMDVLRGDNLGEIGNVINQHDEIVNKKILVIDRQTNGTKLKAYNNQTKHWDII